MEMDNIVAMCGLACKEYIAYVAAQKNDYDLRQKTIEAWSTQTERLTPSDIDYDGGQVGKRIYKFCSTCEVMKCGLETGLANCGRCSEYPCEKLEKLWKAFRRVSLNVNNGFPGQRRKASENCLTNLLRA